MITKDTLLLYLVWRIVIIFYFLLENNTVYYRKKQVHLTLLFINWAAVHVKPVGFLNDVICFKLSSVVVMALYQVK